MTIPENIKTKAIERAKLQGMLANSPGNLMKTEGIVLCAAACLAYAGLQEYEGTESANEFLARISEKNSKGNVKNIFSKYGWGEDICDSIMIQNDALPADARLNWFQTYLQGP